MDNINSENKILSHEYECDECFAKGICSLNPNLSSIHEIILLYLKELGFYLTRLKKFGITNEVIKETVMYALFNLITNVDYNQDQFQKIISNLYDYIYQSKIIYEKVCAEQNIEMETHKTYFKYSKIFDLSDAIRKGEKYFIKKSHSLSTKQKDFYDILLFLGKSMTIKLLELQRLGKDNEEAYYSILSLLDTDVSGDFTEETVKLQIEKIIDAYYGLFKQVFYTQRELYGKQVPTEVSFSTLPGKAILVSGSDLKKLENVLKAAEGTEISVYTHGIEMLMAHTYPKIKSHPNLRGHFGSSMESTLVDFASFPGSILMTKATLQKIEYLYRGRLFTLDPITSQGIVVIKNNNYEPLIKSALSAKGFVHGVKKPSMKVGFDNDEMKQKINQIIAKMKTGEIKHLYIVGLLNLPNLVYKQYFEEFFKLMPKDCFVFSLCCPINNKNVFHLDSFYDYSLLYKIIKELRDKTENIANLNLSIFLTKCDKHTISNLLYLNHIGVKSLLMCKCPANVLNPSIIKTLQETFNIREISDPKSDLEYTLSFDIKDEK